MAEVLAAAYGASATGTIAVEVGRGETRVYVRYGAPVGVEEPGGLHSFGLFLVAHGVIDEDTHERVVALAAEQSQRYGELLVAEGRLNPEEVRQRLIEHHQGALTQLCQRREGKYELRGWERPPDWTEGIQLDPLRAIVESLQVDALFERRADLLSRLGASRLRRSVGADDVLRQLRPGPLERRVLVTLNVPRRADEIGLGLLPPAAAEAFACALAMLGVVEPDQEHAAAPAASEADSGAYLRALPEPEASGAVVRPSVSRAALARPYPARAVPARPSTGFPAEPRSALEEALASPLDASPGPARAERRPPTGPAYVDPPPARAERRPPTSPVYVDPPPAPVPVEPEPAVVEAPPPRAKGRPGSRLTGDEFEFEAGGDDEPLELDLERAPRQLKREPPPERKLPERPRPVTGHQIVDRAPAQGPAAPPPPGADAGKGVRAPSHKLVTSKKSPASDYNPFTLQLAIAKEREEREHAPQPPPQPPPQRAPPPRPVASEAEDIDARLDAAIQEITGRLSRAPAAQRVPPAPPQRPARGPVAPPDDILADIADLVGQLPAERAAPVSIDEIRPGGGTPGPGADIDLALMAAHEASREESGRHDAEDPLGLSDTLENEEELVSDPTLDEVGRPPPEPLEELLPPAEPTPPPPPGRAAEPPAPRPEVAPAPPPDAPRDDVRRRMVQRALRSVGSPVFAREEPAAKPEPAEPRPTGMKAENIDAALEKEIRARLARPATDHFGRLDVPRTVEGDAVKEAFLQLARRFHPDRFAAAGQFALLPQVRELFGQVKESYDVLVDPASRARHLAELETAEKGPRRTPEEAKTAFQKAQVYLRRKDLKNAEAELVMAVEADPRAEYLAELAWTLLSNPNRREEALAQIHELSARAVKASPPSDRAFVVAAFVARTDGEAEKSEKLFRRALELNPRNVDAGREVRLTEMRRGTEKKGGLLDKLRRK